MILFDDLGLLALACLGLFCTAAAVLVMKSSATRRRYSSEPPFRPRPLLNKGEARLLTILDRVVPDILGPSARVCPQVSYGEFLACSKFSKFARMNSRRADFVVISGDHRVALAVELQGSGHLGRTSKSAKAAHKADRTKRRALIEAGVPLLEVGRAASETAIAAQIRGLISPHQEGRTSC